ncbi:MAG: hypothetical protein LBK13_06060 [Spirochaetales bacterium]|jgi:hypothetical protein|nr:hypothetical protein [Spirochaetales bacterium]
MDKVIKDIRYYASNFPNEDGKSLPGDRFFTGLMGTKNNYTKYGKIIARKLNEMNFLSGEFDHIYINYSTAIEDGKINISNRKPEKWIQYIDYGITENKIKRMDENSKIKFIIGTTFLCVFELYKNDKDKTLALKSVREQLEEYGDLLKIKYKTKAANKWKTDVFYQINPNGINETKCIIEYRDNNKCFCKELFFSCYEDIYAIIDNITVKNDYIIINPKKSYRASLHIKDIIYEIPI